MAAVDAQFYWMSAKVPNDDFLLYAFDGEPAELERAIEQVCRRARACPDLTLRVRDGSALTYPQWVPAAIRPEQVVCHDLADATWRGCLAAVVGLADNQLDIRRMPWRLHVFTPVLGIPGVTGAGAVAVMQVPHAVADGIRGAAMAAWLFGRDAPVTEVARLPAGFLPWRAADAARNHRQLVRDTQAGLLAPGLGSRPRLPTNARPDGPRSMRTLVRHRAQLSGPTVTVAVLAAVSTALSGLLGGPVDSLGARCRWPNPVCHMRITTSATSPSGFTLGLAWTPGSSGSRPTWPMAGAASSIRPPALPTGPSPRYPRRCCIGASPCSTRMPSRPRSPATPWCPAFTAEPPI